MKFLEDIANDNIFTKDDVVTLIRISDIDYPDYEILERENPTIKYVWA